MTLRSCGRALSSPPRLSIVYLHQIVGLPSHAAVWHRFAIQSGVGHSGHLETGPPGSSGKETATTWNEIVISGICAGLRFTGLWMDPIGLQ